MFGGWEVCVHGGSAILYYVYANIVIILVVYYLHNSTNK